MRCLANVLPHSVYERLASLEVQFSSQLVCVIGAPTQFLPHSDQNAFRQKRVSIFALQAIIYKKGSKMVKKHFWFENAFRSVLFKKSFCFRCCEQEKHFLFWSQNRSSWATLAEAQQQQRKSKYAELSLLVPFSTPCYTFLVNPLVMSLALRMVSPDTRERKRRNRKEKENVTFLRTDYEIHLLLVVTRAYKTQGMEMVDWESVLPLKTTCHLRWLEHCGFASWLVMSLLASIHFPSRRSVHTKITFVEGHIISCSRSKMLPNVHAMTDGVSIKIGQDDLRVFQSMTTSE